jgi:hypothetical protein
MAHNIPWPTITQPRPGTRVAFDESTAAAHEVAAATSGVKWRVLRGWLQNLHGTDSVSLYFTDATGAISQTWRVNAGDTCNFGYAEGDYWQSDNSGEALSLVLSAACQVRGEIWVEAWTGA